jgi:DNA repair exonuclease SbcCD ATPase subunit
MVAYRFAGLHAHGRPTNAPDAFASTHSSDVTLFEGRNGSGKTPVLNAIVWCIAGNLIRSQRAPESGMTDPFIGPMSPSLSETA